MLQEASLNKSGCLETYYYRKFSKHKFRIQLFSQLQFEYSAISKLNDLAYANRSTYGCEIARLRICKSIDLLCRSRSIWGQYIS